MKRILLTAAFVALGVVGCNKQDAGVTGKNGEVLNLTAPKTVTINPGETSPLKLSITRKQFDGPVTIEFAQLPTGVTVVESEHTIPKGVSDITFTLKAADNATGQGHAVKVSASGGDMKAGPVEFVVNVGEKKGASPDPNQKEALSLTVPKKLTIHPGETTPVKIGVTRKQFDGAVTIEFTQLPMGVTVVESERIIPKGANEATFTLKAASNATLGQGNAVKVSATGDGMKVPPADLILDVTEKKAANLEQKRKDLEKDIHASLEETNKEIAKLEERAKSAKGPAKEEADAALVKLRQSRDELDKRLKESQNTTEEAWDKFSTGLHNAAVDLKNSTRQALDKMK